MYRLIKERINEWYSKIKVKLGAHKRNIRNKIILGGDKNGVQHDKGNNNKWEYSVIILYEDKCGTGKE